MWLGCLCVCGGGVSQSMFETPEPALLVGKMESEFSSDV